MTKKRLEDATRQVAARDEALAELREREALSGGAGDNGSAYLSLADLDDTHWRVTQCIKADHSEQVWCLVVEQTSAAGAGEGDSAAIVDDDGIGLGGDDDDDVARSAWFLQEDLRGRLGADGELPALGPSPSEFARMSTEHASALRDLRAFKEEYRKYRIKSEMLIRQKDAELSEAKGHSLSLQETRISREDLEAELKDARAQLARLSRARTAQGDAERELKAKNRELSETLADAKRETASLRRRCDEAEAEAATAKAALERANAVAAAATPEADGAAAPTSVDDAGSAAGAPDGSVGEAATELERLTQQHSQLRNEYGSYRKRAMELIREKDEEIERWRAMARAESDGGVDDSASVGAGSFAAFMTGTGATGVDGSEAAKREYLKNVVLRYMTTTDDAVRMQLEAAIAAVLELTPSEMARVRAVRSGAVDSLWGKATWLFGGGS